MSVGRPGGTYDVGARIVARFMPKYLPGHPVIVVQNMPGGGNMLAKAAMALPGSNQLRH